MVAVALAVCVVGVARPASAASEDQCQNNVDCPSGEVCLERRCVDPDQVFEYVSADEACGADRRCRIERLERRNRARRHARMLKEEAYVEKLLEERRDSFIDEQPRVDRPWVVDYRISRLGPVGIAAGYSLDGHLRPELQLVYWDSFVGQGSLSNSQPVTFIMPGLFYYFLDDIFSPYLGGSFLYAFGNISSLGFGRSELQNDLNTVYHAVAAQGGLDMQLGAGVHAKAGLAFRPLIYHQARVEPGEYNAEARDSLEEWYRQMVRIDFVFQVGWSF